MVLESFQLNGKNALVTGSSRGLGAAIAIALAQAGANVGCHGRSADGKTISERIRQLGRKSFYLAGDMASPDFHTALIGKTIEDLGSIDILVNNAGTIRRAPAAEFPQNYWDEVIAVNLTSVFRLSQLAGRDMLKREQKARSSTLLRFFHFKVELRFQRTPPPKAGWRSSPELWPTSGRRRVSTSMRSRRVIWPPITQLRCDRMLSAAVKSWRGFRPAAGENHPTLPAQPFFSARPPATTCTGTSW
jgi:NAD(P)-dependent dehydrogenase (short-subunit alcohol dehydrogenase family)